MAEKVDITQAEGNIEKMIDRLKGLCSQSGLGNQAGEEEVITSLFVYKFINDTMTYNLNKFADEYGYTVEEILDNKDDMLNAFYEEYAMNAAIAPEDRIEVLNNKREQKDFAEQVDTAFTSIANDPRNKRFTIIREDGTRIPLLSPITGHVQSSRKNNFCSTAFDIITEYSFEDIFDYGSFDFFSRIFEYLIADYNVASGKYAEYFTPQAVSRIIARCLLSLLDSHDTDKTVYDILDPSAGSGSLVIHSAHQLGQTQGINNANIYTQDISAKSTRFCRLNMILNGHVESLSNIIQGDTLLHPGHYAKPDDPQSGLKKFDIIVANPPFNVDFSSTRDAIEQQWKNTNRFFAGLPTIPKTKLDSMSIYLAFIQHILYSLTDDGIAAIVLPSGFLTKDKKIEMTIKKELVDTHILRGVITMPDKIFALTGTAVSVIFLDKSCAIDPTNEEEVRASANDKVILIDASNMGHKAKPNGIEKTVLTDNEENEIVDIFTNHTITDNSVEVTYEDITNNNYSISAGEYFAIPLDITETIDNIEFENRVKSYLSKIQQLSEQSQLLAQAIQSTKIVVGE